MPKGAQKERKSGRGEVVGGERGLQRGRLKLS